ncbi:MAG: MFS transporter [Acidimicrobiales bacterium]
MTTTAPTRNGRWQTTFASLHVRNFRLYFIGQTVSFAGNWMQIVALATLVHDLTGSGTKLGLVYMVQFAPVMAFGAYGGVLADRFDRRRLSMLTQLLLAVLATTIGVLTLSGHVRLWMIFVIAALIGTVSSFDHPVRQSIVFDLVGPEYVANAVSLNTVVMNVARLTGPTIAAILIATAGIGWSFVGNAVSFVFMFVVLIFIRPREFVQVETALVRAQRGWLREGFRHVRTNRRLLVPLVMMTLIGMLTYEFQVSLPLFASDTFHRGGGKGYAMVTASMGAGAIVGGLLSASRPDPTHARLMRSATWLGASVLVVSIMPTIWWAMVALPFAGAFSVTYIALANSVLQVNADPLMRGRVMALYTMAFMGTTPLGAPIIGAIADHFGPRVALQIGGVAAIAGGVAGWYALRDVIGGFRANRSQLQPSSSSLSSSIPK